MAELHPAASDHLPAFITPPGQTDVLMVVTGIILLLAVLGFGILFLRLHSLPERMAHKSQKIQFEIVAVLCLIALFTHMHIFWIAALLLALIDLPDFGTALGRIAGSAEKIAGIRPGQGAAAAAAAAEAQSENASQQTDETAKAAAKTAAESRHGDAAVRLPTKPEIVPAEQKAPIHA
jgi:ABC-type Na+ efflux pump permease subunit